MIDIETCATKSNLQSPPFRCFLIVIGVCVFHFAPVAQPCSAMRITAALACAITAAEFARRQ